MPVRCLCACACECDAGDLVGGGPAAGSGLPEVSTRGLASEEAGTHQGAGKGVWLAQPMRLAAVRLCLWLVQVELCMSAMEGTK